MSEPVLVSWSGGKDSLMALAAVLRAGHEVLSLITTFDEERDVVPIQNLTRAQVTAQAEQLDLPLEWVALPSQASNVAYEQRLSGALLGFRECGVRQVVFGDLFLADIRAYRERFLADLGMEGLFPLWGEDTLALVRRFLAMGHRAKLSAVDETRLPASWLGLELDEVFLADLPKGVDPCGENGEFHTWVYEFGDLLPRNAA